MAEVTLNGKRVFSAEIVLLASGVSWLEAHVDSATPITGRATLVAPGLTFVGTVDPDASGAFQERATVRVYAGAGGTRSSIGPRHYRGVGGIPISVPLADLLTASGESLHADADAALVARVLQAWARPAGRVDSALADLIETQGGGVWRIGEDGKLWVGTHDYAEQSFAHQLIEHDLTHHLFVVASERLTARPGRTFLGKRVSEVRFEISAGKTRTRIVYGNNLPATFRASIERLVEHKIDASRAYAATVISQNADGTLELKPDETEKIAPLSKVPIRYGIPGVTAEVSRGARVHVFFSNGDREKPIAALWEPENSTLVRLAFDGGTASVARVGDTIVTDYFVITAPGGPGGPCTLAPATALTPGAVRFTGTITSGAAKVKA